MPFYDVKVLRTTEHTTEIKVQAENEDQAETLALKQVEDPASDEPLEWDLYDTQYEVEEVNEEDEDPLVEDDDD